ncbi:VWA domain-containing protein [Saccharothrix hoggarensis]|uniref:VWA domain-containing protein n=1 Tax=Saccharothrix hoggarensis TaxID=913853 RepID=A0ABW3QTK1_9PSEU
MTADALDQDSVIKSKCLPTYLVFDISGSMKPHEALLNDTLEFLYNVLVENPRVSEFAQVSIISFSTAAQVVVEMTDIQDLRALPQFSCGGSTNYSAAFAAVQQRIDQDVPALNAGGKGVLRPAVFMMTDGVPTDPGWEAAFQNLVAKSWRRHPHVISYGFGEARPDVLAKIATKGAFIAEKNTESKTAITEAVTSMLRTLVASAKAEQLQLPTEVEGFTTIPLEYMD